MKYRYIASQQLQDKIYIETGKRLTSGSFVLPTVEFADTDFTPDQRATLLKTEIMRTYPYNVESRSGFFTLEFVPRDAATTFNRFGKKVSYPQWKTTDIAFDSEPTIDDLISARSDAYSVFLAHLEDYTNQTEEAKAHQAEIIAQEKEAARIRAEEADALKQRKAEEAEAARQAAMVIPWKDNGTAIVNLHDAVWACSKFDEPDTRFHNWIKRVDSVDVSQNNGYCFVGDWLHNQTIEVNQGKMVFIVAATSGSRKHNFTEYRVVVLDGGELHLTDITADSQDAGWALRIRDAVAELL